MAVAVIAGATGLVGSRLLNLLLEETYYARVVALTRKPLQKDNTRLHNIVANFDSMDAHADSLKCDDVFCCLGTTIRQAGSQAAFRKVDFDYPLNLARLAKLQGAKQFLLVTAMGSDKNSSIFYNRVKGEVEEAIGAVGFASYHIFQPSMLLGDRAEARAGETAGKLVMKALNFMIPGKYKAIEGEKVARAMAEVAKSNQQGKHIHFSDELQKFGAP